MLEKLKFHHGIALKINFHDHRKMIKNKNFANSVVLEYQIDYGESEDHGLEFLGSIFTVSWLKESKKVVKGHNFLDFKGQIIKFFWIAIYI